MRTSAQNSLYVEGWKIAKAGGRVLEVSARPLRIMALTMKSSVISRLSGITDNVRKIIEKFVNSVAALDNR